jgi:phage-related protein
MADRTYLLKIIADIADFKKKLGEADDQIQGFKKQASNYAKVVGGVVATGAAINFGKDIVNAASDQEQAIGALNSVFGDFSGTMNEFGKTTASNLGITRAEFSQTAAITGSLLKGAGVPLEQVASSTKSMTERAADMAAMFGGTVPEAMDAMNSALKGERDPIEKYGVSLNEAAIKAKAVSMGLADSKGNVDEYGKKMATLQLIMEKTADSQGTFAKESDSMAGSTQIMKAQFADLQADLGKKLLPIIVEVAGVLRGLITFVANNTSWLVPLATGLVAVVAGFKAWTLATQVWGAATKIATGLQWLWNAAMTANPIGLIVAAIAAVVAAVVLLYMKVDWFRAGVDAAIDGVVAAFQWLWDMIKKVWEWVSDNWPLLLAIITGPIGIAVKIIIDHWDTIKSAFQAVIDFIRQVIGTVYNILTLPFRTAIDAVKRIIDEIPNAFRAISGIINSALSGIWDVITYPFKRGWDAAKAAGDTVIGWFGTIKNGINNMFSGLADVITYPFRTAFDAIKRLWNSTVGGFGFSVPSWVPGIAGKGWTIPKMATGGIVTRPTIALIGEAGPEAVVPLSAGGVGLGGVTINVYALTANAEVGRKVYEALREYQRISGNQVA